MVSLTLLRKRRANAETPRQGVALRGPAAASDEYELLPHDETSVLQVCPLRAAIDRRVSVAETMTA